jgi:hypothetical protein
MTRAAQVHAQAQCGQPTPVRLARTSRHCGGFITVDAKSKIIRLLGTLASRQAVAQQRDPGLSSFGAGVCFWAK